MPHPPRRIRPWPLLILLITAAGFFLWHGYAPAPTGLGGNGRENSRGETRPSASRASEESAAAVAQRPTPRELFAYVRPQNPDTLDHALPAPARRIHYVEIDRTLVVGKQSPFWQHPGAGRVALPLPEGGMLTVVIDDSTMLGPDRFTSSGRVEGHPGSRVLFAWNGGFLHASVEDGDGGSFALRTITIRLAQFYRLDPTLVPPCGGAIRPPRMAALRSTSGVTELDTAIAAPLALSLPDNPQHAEVHVMMLYTPAVLDTMQGADRVAALQSAFDLAIAKVNSAFAASMITARVKLVRIAETIYDETRSGSTQVQNDALTALYLENDGQMDEIHALRDQAGADVVMLTLNRPDFASSGLSFLLDSPGEPTNSRFAFSVVQYSSVAGTNVVPHELGHVFGCAHDRENALSGPGAFSYSYGYRFLGADHIQYHDIMSYPPGVELSYFSNPDIVAPDPVNAPLGIAEGRAGESNTSRTIERTAFATAAYRLQTQTPANAGTLINVSTRAFVGTGDEVLIGGLVVQGTLPKKMLIRAAGPALRGFGVGDPLADPILRVFAAGTVVAENDNWGVPVATGGSAASAAEISLAAARASAFAFSAGSADAAVLVTLPPGAYTAVVEGVRGTTGSGLVEAYEIERNAAKLVNLATRGHAGRDGQEMIGGFVVDAAAGSTKRILIRVLGPTLGRAPFNLSGVLDDPEMEVRNAAGERVLASDDWSTAAENGASVENDFHPVVASYGEKRISATGLAPPNRREPCVLADLPPGNYTVVVRPFESRNTDPSKDQPAMPGVGVIEVYEVNP